MYAFIGLHINFFLKSIVVILFHLSEVPSKFYFNTANIQISEGIHD